MMLLLPDLHAGGAGAASTMCAEKLLEVLLRFSDQGIMRADPELCWGDDVRPFERLWANGCGLCNYFLHESIARNA